MSLSHPTRVRGLKHILLTKSIELRESHPTWVRGLKRPIIHISRWERGSHPRWVRGLKLLDESLNYSRVGRTPGGCVD